MQPQKRYKMNKRVIAVVVTFNLKDFLLQVLESLRMQTLPLQKILIVDNNSQDGTFYALSDILLDKNIAYFNTGENLGGAGGFHFGFCEAEKYEYDHLWLMDDDLRPELDCLEKMLETENEGIIQPVRYNIDGSCAEISPVEYDLQSLFLLNPKKETVASSYNELVKNGVLYIQGTPFEGPLVSKKLIDSIGKPNPDFFIFYDDLDYSIRAREAGFKIKCLYPAKATRLLVNNQSNDLNSWKGYFMLRNFFYILRTYGKNHFVRNKPAPMAFVYFFISILKLNFKQAKVVVKAYLDSKTLSGSGNHKP